VSDALRAELSRVAARLGADGVEFVLERPRDAGHGDLATNLAMVLARKERGNPRKTAERVIEELRLSPDLVARTEIAGPGFINFWLAQNQLALAHRRILEQGAAYGRSVASQPLKVNIEFVSANPTGPLHVGHGRGAALGDGIAALHEWTGHTVTREFYINDAGVQIDKLAQSLWARVQQEVGREAEIPEGGYFGDYLRENAREVLAREGRGFADFPTDEGVRRCRALALQIQREEQDRDLREFGVRFDVMSSEQGIYHSGDIDRALGLLAQRGLTYEAEGALWLRTTQFGDDKDRVLRKGDGTYTYLVPDIAYHIDKNERGFDRAIDVWGADHHGYIPRMRAVLEALGYPSEFFDVALVQLVKVERSGEEVKMSKRSGQFVTLRDLYEEVGVDAARYFFLRTKGETPMVFDIDIALKQTDENPIFYVQMAHARLSGIFRTANREAELVEGDLDLAALPAPLDTELLKKLALLPEIVEKAAREREPHRITVYLHELATVIHSWYHHTRAIGAPEGPVTEHARLLLARAARITLANALTLLGISAPDRM
jgi:arginyl-tRNA synthetase